MVAAPASNQSIRLAAISDEFSPDVEIALDAMKSVGMTGVELRTIGGRNIVELSDEEIAHIVDATRARRMEIVSLASPLLKCVLPGGPAIDERFQQDVFGSPFTWDDQPRLTRRIFELTRLTGARLVRVFSYWRTVDPRRCDDRIVEALAALTTEAAAHGVTIGLENEYACNVGTAAESVRILERLPVNNLLLIWDPANALILGDAPYPDAYRQLPRERVGHVHVKDCVLEQGRPRWEPPGTNIDWAGQIAALVRDHYRGWFSLETHWRGPTGDRLQASLLCATRLRAMVAVAQGDVT
jgi:L-ribulose-5-phosphate 3-epimerase